MTISEGRPWQRWGAAAIVFGLFVVGALIFVFAGTLTRAGELEREAEVKRAEVAALEARLAAGTAELEFIETDAFVRQQARANALRSRRRDALQPAGRCADPAAVAAARQR